MDDDLRPVAVEQRRERVGLVEVEDRAGPRQRPERSGERRLLEGRHEGPAEPSARAGDRDAHAQASVEAASRAPYWRS